MPCSRALRCEPVGVLVRNRHGQLVEQLAARSETRAPRARTPETRRAAPAGTARSRRRPSRSSTACGRCSSRICARSSGLARSVWQAAAAYRMTSSWRRVCVATLATAARSPAATRSRSDDGSATADGCSRPACCSARGTRDAPACAGSARPAGTDSCVIAAKRQRRDRVRARRAQVHLLAVAVGVEQERPRPARPAAAAATRASNDSAISSPGRETTNMSSTARRSGRTSPSRV